MGRKQEEEKRKQEEEEEKREEEKERKEQEEKEKKDEEDQEKEEQEDEDEETKNSLSEKAKKMITKITGQYKWKGIFTYHQSHVKFMNIRYETLHAAMPNWHKGDNRWTKKIDKIKKRIE